MIKLFFHFSVYGFSNSYIISQEESRDALIIDPGIFELALLELIESHNLYIRHILVTHNHESHVKGITTLRKVYDAEIFSASRSICNFPSIPLSDGDTMLIGGFNVLALEVPGHSSDSLVYKIDQMLFTGDVIGAGRIGKTFDPYLGHLLHDRCRAKLFSFKENLYIYPGHGPPTTLDIERKFNPAFDDLHAGLEEGS